MIAWLNLRYTGTERQRIFQAGLERHGYEVKYGTTMHPRPKDIFLSWNRIGIGHQCAQAFEALGYPVLVAENAAWGNTFAGEHWYSLAPNYHNLNNPDLPDDPARWDALAVDLAPFRTAGEVVILPQRGIGSHPYVMPKDWPQKAHAKYGGRIRQHPGRNKEKPLEDDLAHAGRVVTWGSGAAIRAIMWGIPVIYEMPLWVGACDNSEQGRLDMLRRLAWQQFTLKEIELGIAFDLMLS